MNHKLKLENELIEYIGGFIMEDFRFLQDNCLWIVIIALFVIFCLGGNGCNSFGSGCGFGNLFDGCGNNSWLWILVIIVIFCCLCKNDCGIFRSDLQ